MKFIEILYEENVMLPNQTFFTKLCNKCKSGKNISRFAMHFVEQNIEKKIQINIFKNLQKQ